MHVSYRTLVLCLLLPALAGVVRHAHAGDVGACCDVADACVEVLAEDCVGANEVFLGSGTTCAAGCPSGACCAPPLLCAVVGPIGCDLIGGAYFGDDVTCAAVTCPEIGACCFDDGGCVTTGDADCTAQGGSFRGLRTDCVTVNCPQPGGCCDVNNTCTVVLEVDCNVGPTIFLGEGTTCVDPGCPTGACCRPNNTCDIAGPIGCGFSAGTYFGDDSVCDGIDCSQGACCLDDGGCFLTVGLECTAQGGLFRGLGSDCATAGCPQPGACCDVNNMCTVVQEDDCDAGPTIFLGPGTTCDDPGCPTGACCRPNNTCDIAGPIGCGFSGGSYFGDDSICDGIDCSQGACCLDDGGCFMTVGLECTAQGGLFRGLGSECATVGCPQPGACCDVNNMCTVVFEEDCDGPTIFLGPGTTCDDPGCPTGACCRPNGTCDITGPIGCAFSGGTYFGDDSICDGIDCTRGACCFDDGCLEVADGLTCSNLGGAFRGRGSLCATVGCPPAGACCSPDGSCAQAVNLGGADCTDAGGEYQGDGIGCADVVCRQPCDLPGRPDPAGSSDRVLRGYIVGWAVDEVGRPVRWNHLAAGATVVSYRDVKASQHDAWTSAAVGEVDHGAPVGDGSAINLDGVDYAAAYGLLHFDFFAPGSGALDGPGALVTHDTTLTVHPVSVDFRDGGAPVATLVRFDVWNENEIKLSGARRCVVCWDSTLLSDYGVPNHFVLPSLQTDLGRTRLDGISSPQCAESVDAAILGIRTRHLAIDGRRAATATSLVGMGTESASIVASTMTPPPEAPDAPRTPDATARTVDPLGASGAVTPRGSSSEKGSVLFLSKIEIRWDQNGRLVQDTFLQLTNDHPDGVRVQLYFVNGDPPLIEDDEVDQCVHPGWNALDNLIDLTGNQTFGWSAVSGSGVMSPFTVLDP